MITRLSFLTLAMVGIAGIAHAQSTSAPAYSSPGSATMQSNGNERYQAMMGDESPNAVALTDEYGFKYNSRGDRLDARGHIIAPPVTPPGARALK